MVPLARTSARLREAVLSIEDYRFHQHGALDLRGTLRALLTNVGSEDVVQGGSSITQQLVKQTLVTQADSRAEQRAATERSYTRKLMDKGVAQCAKKLGEEAVETVIAAVAQDDEHLVAEAADLLYHLLVVLEARGVAFAAVEDALAKRSGISGLAEKAGRPRD